MAQTKKEVRYGVGNAEHYSEKNPYIDSTLTAQEAVAQLKEWREDSPSRKFRIFKRERTDVVTDVTDELV